MKCRRLEQSTHYLDKSTQTPNWPCSPQPEETPLCGIASLPESTRSTPSTETSPSVVTISQKLMSPLKESDGTKATCSSQAPKNHFALTFRPSQTPIKDIAATLKRHPNVRAFMIGALETSGRVDSEPHYHCYLRFRLRQKPYLIRSFFPTKIAWLKPIEPNLETTFTHTEAVNAYIKYCTKNGPALYKEGDFMTSTKTDKSKSSQILDLVKQGYRRTQLETQFPAMTSTIARLMTHRPSREHETRCLFVWGPPGTGKSTTIHRVLQALKKLDWRADYYPKMGALKKFWDGYDNQPIVFIDDPGQFNVKFSDEDTAAFKNVVSTGAHIVEIKGGCMQFDSHLVIVVSNTDPDTLSNTAGLLARDAVYDRLVGSRAAVRGGIFCPDQHTARMILKKKLIYLCCSMLSHIGVHIESNDVFHEMDDGDFPV